MRITLPFIHPERWSRRVQLLYAFFGPAVFVPIVLAILEQPQHWPRHIVAGLGAGFGCWAAVAWATRRR